MRIFTTRNTKLLHFVDHIIFLKDGEIVELGDYSELLNNNEYFADYLKMNWQPKTSVTKNEMYGTGNKDTR